MRAIIASALVLNLSFLSAQPEKLSFGFSGGVSVSTIKQMNDLQGIYKLHSGVSGDLRVRLFLFRNFFIQTGTGFYQDGYYRDQQSPLHTLFFHTENRYYGNSTKVRHNYFKNDWLFGYETGSKIRLSLSAGVYLSHYRNSGITYLSYVCIDPKR